MRKMVYGAIVVLLLVSNSLASPLMIEEKNEYLEKIKTENIAIIFYGHNDT